jgi:hypothetical protein
MNRSEKKSKYLGVILVPRKSCWVAQIVYNKKCMRLGSFVDEVQAARCYDDFIRLNKLDKRMNFPDSEPENLIPNTRLIRLTQGKFAIVDDEDFELASQYIWYAKKDKNTYYARRNVTRNSECKLSSLHNLIMGSNKMTDHINGNGLDDRKINLRHCTNAENSQNSRPAKNKSSKFKGVSYFRHCKRFSSQIRINGTPIVIGYFINELDAAKAYDEEARKHFGEFARVNFPDDLPQGASAISAVAPPITATVL